MTATRALSAPALPASLDDVQDLVNELFTSARAASDLDRFRFESAVVEIAGNIIEHSRPSGAAAQVTLTVTLRSTDEALTAEFVDDGAPADVDLDVVGMPGEDAESGRGLPLVLATCDVLRYERADELNRWVIGCTVSG